MDPGGHGLSCSVMCGILVPGPQIKPVPAALEGGFLTAGPPGRPLFLSLRVARSSRPPRLGSLSPLCVWLSLTLVDPVCVCSYLCVSVSLGLSLCPILRSVPLSPSLSPSSFLKNIYSGTPCGMWDLSSLTGDRTSALCIGRPILNHWTAREVPVPFPF